MSDLLNQASLVMVPSGYKEDTVYSVVPSDGSGDLSFTRASNGTRVNSAGLVEVTPWNLVENSENFDAVWAKYNGATVTVNAITAPNGTTTADLLIAGASQEVYSANMPKVAEELYYTFSCYAKVYNTNVFRIVCSDFSTSGSVGTFDLSTQSATFATGATWSNVSASMESVGNGWYRCILSGKSPATTGLYLSLLTNGTNSVSGVYIWGAQVNIGSTAKPYFPTTDRLNVPRVTYQNGGGGCPSLLLEKQSTNEALYSNTLETAAWGSVASGTACSITTNDTTSPDGTQNASKITYNTAVTGSGTYSLWRFTKSTSANGTYSISVWLKAGTITKTYIRFSDSGGNRANLECNLTSEWQRFTLTGATASSISTIAFDIGADGNGGQTQTSGYLYAWGAQLEASSYATSYIPTTSSSATRVADACFKTGISSLIGQTEGVLFADVNFFQTGIQYDTPIVLTASGGAGGGYVVIDRYPNKTIVCEYYNGGSIAKIISSTTYNEGRLKIAFGYKQNDFVAYVNGVQIGTDTSGNTTMTLTELYMPYTPNASSVGINETILFPTRLTNAELASLTTI